MRYYTSEKYIDIANETDIAFMGESQLWVVSCPRCWSGVCVGQRHCAYCGFGTSKEKFKKLVTNLRKIYAPSTT